MTPRDVLRRYFGFHEFRGPQEEIIRRVAGGAHALVIMPTGMGKSLCYQIPALMDPRDPVPGERTPLTLVLSPLIALMKDQVDALVAKGIDATYINSSLSRTERLERYEAIARGDAKLLYVTPERFRKPEFLDVIARREIRLLAVDEAHCISEWGHDFRPDYTRLAELRQLVHNPTTLALTATATPEVQEDIIRQLGLARAEVKLYHEGIDRPNLELDVQEVWSDDDKLEWILKACRDPAYQAGSGIVYFTLIRTLGRFSDRLTSLKIPHLCYHGDLDRQGRRRIQNAFMNNKTRLVLATNAFGMGIDKEDIRFVLHADVPGSMEAYYQEIGRAGRDGKPSLCQLLYAENDLMTQIEFIRWSNPDGEFYTRLYGFLTDRHEEVRSYGLDWLNEQLQPQGRHDHRMETGLAILHRYGVLANDQPPGCFEVLGPLPQPLQDSAGLAEKLTRDQRKLYALVEYVKYPDDRKQFINQYFGICSDS